MEKGSKALKDQDKKIQAKRMKSQKLEGPVFSE
jgi:hypothetical protein